MADDTTQSVPTSTPTDPTPYIRTYAKDVARLTGTQPAVSPGALFKKDAPEPGVLLPEVDESARQSSSTDPVSPKEFPQEIIEVTKDDTVSNINNTPQKSPAWSTSSSMPHAPIGNAPNVSSREDKRDEILSRLRAKVGKEMPSAPAPTPVPIPSVPPTEAFPQIQPRMVSAPTFGAPVQAFPFRAPKSLEVPVPSDPTPDNLHTFKSDFADHIDDKKASTFSVLAAQSDARDVRATTPQPAVLKSKKNYTPLLIGAAVLILVGTSAVGGAYWFIHRTPSAGSPFEVPSLIFADEKIEINDSGSGYAATIAQIAQQSSVNGNVIVTYTTTSATGKKGVIKSALPGGPIIKSMFHTAPDILLRNIDDSSTVGVVDSGDTTAPFFILHVASYERTFAGMLGWESTVANDLTMLYPASPDAPVQTSSGTLLIGAARFTDEVVTNHDVRALKDSTGRTILLYGYRDKQTLIIAKDEASFTLLINRLSAATGT